MDQNPPTGDFHAFKKIVNIIFIYYKILIPQYSWFDTVLTAAVALGLNAKANGCVSPCANNKHYNPYNTTELFLSNESLVPTFVLVLSFPRNYSIDQNTISADFVFCIKMSNNTRERASAVNQASSATTHGKSVETLVRDLIRAVADLNTLLLSVQQEVKEIKQALTQQNKVLASASVMAKELLVSKISKIISKN